MNNDPLDRMARRVAADRFFLASTLAAYQQHHGLDDYALAAQLGCAPAVLASVRLCRRPGAAAPDRTAEEDVAEIARRFGLDAEALARVVQEADGQ
ncbi:MAG TPA: hypothetical protein VKA46_33855 [Gemmataceae bacterium]|nr:hypothetical protein [Gemmataceae bacterium]